jgi:hypothetical protein
LLDLRIEVGRKIADIKKGHEKNLPQLSTELKRLILRPRLSPLERFLTAELLVETDRRTDSPNNPESAKYISFAKYIEQLKIDNCQKEVFEGLQKLTQEPQFWYALLANSLNDKMQHQTNFEHIDQLLASNKQSHQETPQAKALLAELSKSSGALEFFPRLLGSAIPADLGEYSDDLSLPPPNL